MIWALFITVCWAHNGQCGGGEYTDAGRYESQEECLLDSINHYEAAEATLQMGWEMRYGDRPIIPHTLVFECKIPGVDS